MSEIRPTFTHNQLYGRRWKKRARAHLASSPLCIWCEKEGRGPVAATCVHHLNRVNGDINVHWQSPLVSLCDYHHNSVAQKLEKAVEKSKSGKVRIMIGADGWPVELTLEDYVAMKDPD